jgi:hypothetical protein
MMQGITRDKIMCSKVRSLIDVHDRYMQVVHDATLFLVQKGGATLACISQLLDALDIVAPTVWIGLVQMLGRNHEASNDVSVHSPDHIENETTLTLTQIVPRRMGISKSSPPWGIVVEW